MALQNRLDFNLQFFGGRGASSGISVKGKKYGTEYETLFQDGNIKFVRYNGSKQATAPMETMKSDRIYVTINNNDKIKYITFYDKNNMRERQIDVNGKAHTIDKKKRHVHTHLGYNHDENGTRVINSEELKLIRQVRHIWYNYKNCK